MEVIKTEEQIAIEKEKERLRKEKEKQKEKERLQKEKEKQKEKERLQKEKEKQKEKERLQKEKEKQKEKERLQKEKEALNKQPSSTPSKPFILTPKEGVDAKPLVSRAKEEKPKVEQQEEIKMIDDLSEEDINLIKQSEKENSLNKMQSIVEAREKLNNASSSNINSSEKDSKIKIGKISFTDESQETEEIAVLKQRSNNQKSIENEMLSKKESEIQNKLKEANATFGIESPNYKVGETNELFSSKIQDLMEKIQELEENNNILNETLDAVERIEYDGIKLFDPDTFELSPEFLTHIENIKQNDSSEKVVELENRLQEILVELDSYKNAVNSSVTAESNDVESEVEDKNLVNNQQNSDEDENLDVNEINESDNSNQTNDNQETLEKTDNIDKDNTVVFEEVKPIPFMKKVLSFFVDSFNGMAYGLFATLIIGVIFEQLFSLIVQIPFLAKYSELFKDVQNGLKLLMGVGIALGISRSLKLDGLKLISATIAGGLASYLYNPELFGKNANPLTIYLVVIGTIGLIKLVFKKKTPVDIVLIPLFSVVVSVIINQLIYLPIDVVMNGLSGFIDNATQLQPLLMGIVIAVVMGMCLTAPISSAAIAISIGLDGIAGGAALVGCCVQMVGFAVMSRKDNNIGKVLSVGLGTSMLQFKNILKKPVLWLPTIIVSAILGPISTTLLNIKTSDVGAGMGTSGLVGLIQTFNVMGYDLKTWIIVLGFLVILPAILVFIIDILFRKMNLIKEKDLEI